MPNTLTRAEIVNGTGFSKDARFVQVADAGAPETLIFHRLASDANGNPRYVVDYTALCKSEELGKGTGRAALYPVAVKRANSIGGSRYDFKAYRGGIAFQSYSIDETARDISRVTGRAFIAEKR